MNVEGAKGSRSIDLLGARRSSGKRDCWDLLASEGIGRVAVVFGGQVDTFPVNYGLDGNGIVLQRANSVRRMAPWRVRWPSRSTGSMRKPGPGGVWWHGPARHLPLRRTGAHASQPWTGSKDFLLQIAPRSITGRRVVP